MHPIVLACACHTFSDDFTHGQLCCYSESGDILRDSNTTIFCGGITIMNFVYYITLLKWNVITKTFTFFNVSNCAVLYHSAKFLIRYDATAGTPFQTTTMSLTQTGTETDRLVQNDYLIGTAWRWLVPHPLPTLLTALLR